MPTLSSNDQVIATIFLDDDYYVGLILPGKATVEKAKEAGLRNLEPMSVEVTESMLLQMNGFMRAKWGRVKAGFDDETRKRITPNTPEQSF